MGIEQGLLLRLVWAVARDRGYSCRLTGPDLVTLAGPETVTVRLDTVRRLVASKPASEWAVWVGDLIDTRAVATRMERENPLDYGDFTTMRHLLRTRLYGTASVDGDGVRRMVAPGLIQRVLIDGVHTVTHVTYDMLRHWPIGEWDLFTLAERNVRRDGAVQVTRDEFDVPMAEGLPPIALLTGPEYLTAHARWLGDYPVTGPAGAVLIMPAKESIYAYPVTGAEVVRSITILAELAALHADDPWPINSSVYWWRDGHLDLAATTHREDTTVVIRPTSAFHHHTNRLDEQ